MKSFPALGVQIPQVLLPVSSIDQQKWAVIACDQYTSQPDYWEKVSNLVGDSPSTYNLVFPEVFLGKNDEASRIKDIHQCMEDYMQKGILVPRDGIVYVERKIGEKVRRGIMMALDLEQYDFTRGTTSLIRPTEDTIVNRLPPRIKIREQAPLELPHILMLIDDPEDIVIGSIEKQKAALPLAYDVELMLSSGHLTGRFVDDEKLEEQVIKGLQKLADPAVFAKKYGLPDGTPVLLFASGDGNHSLATARSFWQQIKSTVGMDHPARYALVEVENVHDRALEFEPIHRVLFNMKADPVEALKKYFKTSIEFTPVEEPVKLMEMVRSAQGPDHHFGLILTSGSQLVTIHDPQFNLPVGTLQTFLDEWVHSGEAGEIDYVHGDDAVLSLSSKTGNAGFYLSTMPKSDLFKTVIMDGSLPRKAFSMGEAYEKRFYFEARKIL